MAGTHESNFGGTAGDDCDGGHASRQRPKTRLAGLAFIMATFLSVNRQKSASSGGMRVDVDAFAVVR